MSTVQAEARRKLAHAEAMRATLEEAHFDAITRDYPADDKDALRGLWGTSVLNETIARIQARQLREAS